ncbi:hypothetical protein VOLCADRAFT_91641 [Volvox carteri f. nagariensis]|uniref:Uncharacterized protein n=1 Tax=Volvox carteri f. nagariensis TaxID=3068 RepID=D8TXL8_VOLCA|nr:uncharacterized protein VOLCADRAFT_91641 [Volvox carteri f. nagariensis]EFJ47747.1 hypothetical protein VOLCADRAFT_91641 [Volvox carteri f. nagariensis]|eukprot:XP_002951218.1 hypothetical protein VOLCADRAFT_91641 [Volvox carteri f. nagariensis]
MLMFQRQLGAAQNGYARQSSSEFVPSSCAHSRGASRNNSFSRRAPAGHSSLQHSRSRTSFLMPCSAHNGDGSAGDANSPKERQPVGNGDSKSQSQPPQQPQARAGHDSSSRGAPDAAFNAHLPPSSSASNDSSVRPIQREQTWDFSPDSYVPSPANLPTNDDNEPLLYPPRPLWTWTSQPGMDLFRAGPRTWSRLRQVYVILFGVGERETEGIYSLRAFNTDGTPQETIIAFECEEEAQRYAGLLEASMDHKPHEVGSGADPSTLARYSGLSADELDEIRARLEALLPAS